MLFAIFSVFRPFPFQLFSFSAIQREDSCPNLLWVGISPFFFFLNSRCIRISLFAILHCLVLSFTLTCTLSRAKKGLLVLTLYGFIFRHFSSPNKFSATFCLLPVYYFHLSSPVFFILSHLLPSKWKDVLS